MENNVNKAMLGALVLGLLSGGTALAQQQSPAKPEKSTSTTTSTQEVSTKESTKESVKKAAPAAKDAVADEDKDSCAGGKDGCPSKADSK